MKNRVSYQYPETTSIQGMIDGIWGRQYYTNHGPLVVELERRLEGALGVKHAVCMTNGSIALMVSLLALDVKGSAVIPVLSHSSVSQSLHWLGIPCEYCDTTPDRPTISEKELQMDIGPKTRLIVACHAFGVPCRGAAISRLAESAKCTSLFIADGVFEVAANGDPLDNGGAMTIYSFRQSQIINGVDGACVTISNDDLAARLRNIRSSYGAGRIVEIPFTGNGRMSEVQAGMALLSLNSMDTKRRVMLAIRDQLSTYARSCGLSVVEGADVSERGASEYFIANTEHSEKYRMFSEGLTSRGITIVSKTDHLPKDLDMSQYPNVRDWDRRSVVVNLNQRINADQMAGLL